jgi:ankyrin repeat protein
LAVTRWRKWDSEEERYRNRIAQRLLSHGCKVSIQDNDGNTALHLAARLGVWSLLETVLKGCKDSNSPIDPINHKEQTPLDLCNNNSTISRFRAWAKENGFNDLPVAIDRRALPALSSGLEWTPVTEPGLDLVQ